MTTRSSSPDLGTSKATSDIAAERLCLRCRSVFWSEGFGERICPRCKGSAVWRSAVSEGGGQGRRSSGRRPG
ncbi:hypothetical protein SAMN05444002_0989 [Vannielia litorea]|uniref:Uncharacterized protein n=1 Tax=Vannielia litorea TaxID=1217970 RepID=A0A1N6EPR3_9RHOB|nr:hypothetical protein SAMN05444002_0989 [Vannielia litorea]